MEKEFFEILPCGSGVVDPHILTDPDPVKSVIRKVVKILNHYYYIIIIIIFTVYWWISGSFGKIGHRLTFHTLQ